MRQFIYEAKILWELLTVLFSVFSLAFVPMIIHQMLEYWTDCNTIEKQALKEVCNTVYYNSYAIMIILPSIAFISLILFLIARNYNTIIEEPIQRLDALRNKDNVK